jgi:hypothetical protein
LALAAARGMRPLVAHCHLGRGRLHARAGESELARDDLAVAAAMYCEMDMPFGSSAWSPSDARSDLPDSSSIPMIALGARLLHSRGQ